MHANYHHTTYVNSLKRIQFNDPEEGIQDQGQVMENSQRVPGLGAVAISDFPFIVSVSVCKPLSNKWCLLFVNHM